jgi:uncharacterized membrane protein YhfC
MPLGLAVYLAGKLKAEWRIFGAGIIVFILSQVFHIPFNLWLIRPMLGKFGYSLTQSGFQLVIISLIYGLSAGIFEEIFRYIGFRLWVKEECDWKSALMYGAGHGGIESILLGILAFLTFLQVVFLKGVDLRTVMDADQVGILRAQLNAYWAVPWHLAILGAVERLSTIIFHLSASVLIWQSIRRNNLLWLILAVIWHTLADATAVYSSQTWNAYLTELILLGFGLVSLAVILIFKPKNNLQREGVQTDTPENLEHQFPEIRSIIPSEDDLEDSRYI